MNVLNWLFALDYEAIVFLLLAIMEFILRVFPTTRDFSIISNAVKLLNWLLPNLRRPKGDDMLSERNKRVRYVLKDKRRH